MEVPGRKHSEFLKATLLVLFSFLVWSCQQPTTDTQSSSDKTTVTASALQVPDFNSDSALWYLQTQVNFGPRVPGTDAHAQCADFLFKKLQSFGLQTQLQSETISTFDGKRFRLKNIIAEFNPDARQRVLLLAHWDTRPWADQDSVRKDRPFDGANDGASGVAVLLEIARLLPASELKKGIDILLVDLEDYGQEEDDNRFPRMENSWCLGSQYWAKNMHRPGYFAQYGILLDMVGGVNPTFPKEGTSMYFAPEVVNKVWSIAQNMGYGTYFTNELAPQTIDDHLYINQLANIKTIDIVHYDNARKGYPPYHHTHGDNMSVIDKNTLKMVGNVVLKTIFSQ